MEEGLNRLFTLFMIGIVIWVILCVLITYAKIRFAQYIAKEKVNRVKTQHQIRKGGESYKQRKIAERNNIPQDKDYELTKTTFNVAMKSGQLNRQTILAIKDLLNRALSRTKKYDGYYWKNDCHEIYVKLKDGNLGMLEYQEITNLITKGEN